MAYKTSKMQRLGSDLGVSIGLSVVILFFILTGFLSYNNIRTINRGTSMVTHTHDVLITLNDIVSLMKDAETGQRGFVLAGP